MSTRLATSTSPELVGTRLVLVPVGSCEQHGPHLPLHTDTVVAQAVVHRVAVLLGPELPAVAAPAVAYGASGEHQDFAGTSSIGTDALRTVLVELVRSMRTWATRVVFVNGHGGNLDALSTACAQLVVEGHDTGWVPCAPEAGDAHAGRTETSLMLHLDPSAVRIAAAEPGNTSPMRDLLPDLVAGGVAAVAPNGVLGDPTGATAAEGARLLEEMAVRAAGLVAAGTPDARGQLRTAPRAAQRAQREATR